MNEFNTYEKCIELFRNARCLGNSNCIFLAYKDVAKTTGGGLVGGMVSGMEYPYDALLINVTEFGIGMLLIKFPFALKIRPEDMKIQKDKLIYYPNENIINIKVDKVMFHKNNRRITIKTKDNKKYILIAQLNEPNLPYHDNNLAMFIQRYSTK